MSNKRAVWQCSVCDAWTRYGDFLPSGNCNRRTGETPCDNFVCRRCQKEAADRRAVHEAVKRWERSRAA